jgi:DNA (cytosine-5)-methyltransferase 1
MNQKNTSFTFIDLFSGIGGFRLALNNLGGTCLNFSEISKDAIHTYCTNFDEDTSYNLGDITKIKELPKHDLLTGGVPCQSWSIAGRNLGFDDDRGQLWNDTIYLLNQSKPKAFIFENVKGLVDPRNQEALSYILERIRAAGYYASYYVLNSFDYGVPQNRVRIYIIGFLEECFYKKFQLPKPVSNKIRLSDVLTNVEKSSEIPTISLQKDLFGEVMLSRNMSLSNNKGFNDYFLFNDLRNGHSTIHSWDIIETTEHQKNICLLLLKNRRKSAYGNLDGNPLALNHFQALDKSITWADLKGLVQLDILKEEEYTFSITNDIENHDFTAEEKAILACSVGNIINIDVLKNDRNIKLGKLPIFKILDNLKSRNILTCNEIRYDFKNTKISTGLYGVCRIFLPSSNIFPTLVASDTNDFIATEDINASNAEEYKEIFLENIYKKGKYRKITKEEACLIQGFPKNFLLPSSRPRWMKLVGNSVSMPVIQILGEAIIKTGVFDENIEQNEHELNQLLETVAQ